MHRDIHRLPNIPLIDDKQICMHVLLSQVGFLSAPLVDGSSCLAGAENAWERLASSTWCWALDWTGWTLYWKTARLKTPQKVIDSKCVFSSFFQWQAASFILHFCWIPSGISGHSAEASSDLHGHQIYQLSKALWKIRWGPGWSDTVSCHTMSR